MPVCIMNVYLYMYVCMVNAPYHPQGQAMEALRRTYEETVKEMQQAASIHVCIDLSEYRIYVYLPSSTPFPIPSSLSNWFTQCIHSFIHTGR